VALNTVQFICLVLLFLVLTLKRKKQQYITFAQELARYKTQETAKAAKAAICSDLGSDIKLAFKRPLMCIIFSL
jgi:penicillin-binding protein-related factor A (putative recombinase)